MGFPQYRQATPRNMIGLVAAAMLDSNSVIDQEHGRVACRDAIRKIRNLRSGLARGSAQVFAHAAKGRLKA
jgi:hypothetical protein